MPTYYHRAFEGYEPYELSGDVPVYKGDFLKSGTELGMKYPNISKAWKGITRDPAPLLLQREEEGEQLSRREKQFLETVTKDELTMYISPGVLSYNALQANFVSGHLSDMRNVSTKALMLVEHVLHTVAIEVNNEVL